MSDGKEVKRFKFINGVGNWSREEAVLASDYDRIVADKDAKIVRMTSDLVDCDRRIAELRAEVERLNRRNHILEDNRNAKIMNEGHEMRAKFYEMEEAIATQSRVIKIAKRVLHNAGLRPPDGGTPTVETICEDLNDAIKELAAIEQEGAKDNE